ncbi:MAG: PEP-CTERM sorting domain-containing protein [Armatimonadetes bacterium]|nr:PEP-CTERM sorting domain-containing protein [Armatimonadota bacterium]
MRLRFSIALLGFASMAAAGMVYDNGSPNLLGGDDISAYDVAEDFTLTHGASIMGVRFWSLGGTQTGQVRVRIMNADDSGPGGQIFTANLDDDASNTGRSLYGFNELDHTLEIASSVHLNAGHYYLMLDSDPSLNYQQTGVYWESANANSTPPGVRRYHGAGLYTPTNEEHAFQVFGLADPVPEPASLTALGLAALALIRRRK